MESNSQMGKPPRRRWGPDAAKIIARSFPELEAKIGDVFAASGPLERGEACKLLRSLLDEPLIVTKSGRRISWFDHVKNTVLAKVRYNGKYSNSDLRLAARAATERRTDHVLFHAKEKSLYDPYNESPRQLHTYVLDKLILQLPRVLKDADATLVDKDDALEYWSHSEWAVPMDKQQVKEFLAAQLDEERPMGGALEIAAHIADIQARELGLAEELERIAPQGFFDRRRSQTLAKYAKGLRQTALGDDRIVQRPNELHLPSLSLKQLFTFSPEEVLDELIPPVNMAGFIKVIDVKNTKQAADMVSILLRELCHASPEILNLVTNIGKLRAAFCARIELAFAEVPAEPGKRLSKCPHGRLDDFRKIYGIVSPAALGINIEDHGHAQEEI